MIDRLMEDNGVGIGRWGQGSVELQATEKIGLLFSRS